MVTDIERNRTYKTPLSSNSALLTGIILDKVYQRLLISSGSGDVFIYDVNKSPPSLLT